MEERNEEQDMSTMQDEGLMQEMEHRIADALEEVRAQWMQEMMAQIEQAQLEADRLSQMSEDERTMLELDRRIAALDEREREIERRELRAKGAELLQERKLPMELLDAADYSSQAALEQSIDALERAFCAAVQRGIEQRMRGEVPRKARRESDAPESDEEYYRMHGAFSRT